MNWGVSGCGGRGSSGGLGLQGCWGVGVCGSEAGGGDGG